MTNASVQEKRKLMVASLKKIVVPEIKHMGFTGTYPHFRKKETKSLEFVSFQFSRGVASLMGSFVVEFGRTTAKDLPDWAKALPFEKLNYGNAKYRMRIKPKSLSPLKDYWFDYSAFKNEKEFDTLAQKVKKLLPVGEEFCRTGKIPYMADLKK